MIKLITENQLDEWVLGNAQIAQGLVVELISRLIDGACLAPREKRFPLSDSIGQHGPDGILNTPLSFEPHVPEGYSYWEIGTGIKARNKATSDYNNLTQSVPEDIRLQSVFVFVTPLSGRRDWEHTWKPDGQAAWINERVLRKEWKDIRVFDGTKLVEWIHQFPAVEFWLSHKMNGLKPSQVEIPEIHWAIISSIGDPPPLSPEVFLSNRNEASAKLKEVFEDKIVQLKLTTHYPDQVGTFISAYLASREGETHQDAKSRCIIVSEIDAWNVLCNIRSKLILIADSQLDLNSEAGTIFIQKARRAGHAVIFGGPQGGIPDPTSVPLPMPKIHEIQETLEKAGYPSERSRTLAQKSGGNLNSLLRCIQNVSLLPEWAQGTAIAELAIAAFLGSWNENSEADRNVIESIAGKPYGEWIELIREIALRPSTPLTIRDGKWKFVARYEGWYSLGSHLFDEHLDKFKNEALKVLGENDPQFDLPPDERYAANVHGKILKHSHQLRTGLAESLALLGSHSKALTSCSMGKADNTTIITVRKILSGSEWIRWASLSNLLPLLAEAAPDEFLSAVENALQSEPCPFDNLFSQESSGVFGRTYMSGLLWALETLAWEEQYLTRVIMCLGELAKRDPGGQWTNRPSNSMTTILLPWMPQTCASIKKRVVAMKTLISELPDVGWKVLLSLLPKSHSVSSGSRKPAWRASIPNDWSSTVTRKEYVEQVSAYAELVVAEAKKDFTKLVEIVDRLANLPPSAYDKILEYLDSDVVHEMPDADRLSVWTKLVDLIAQHKKFADAEWALPTQEVSKVENILRRLAPSNPLLLYKRYFTPRDYDLYEEKGNYEQQRKDLEKRRQDVILNILKTGGIESVLTFAKEVESPWRVGFSFGSILKNEEHDVEILPSLLNSENKALAEFTAGYVGGKFHNSGWQWADCVVTHDWNIDDASQFFVLLPFGNETWERVTRFLENKESSYWRKAAVNPYQVQDNLDYAIEKLIQYNRPYKTIECIYKKLHDKQPIDQSRAAQALLAALKSSESPSSVGVYQIIDVIKGLQNDANTNPEDLFLIEWAYLRILNEYHDAFPKLLNQKLANEPSFFCEVIRLIFKSNKEDTSVEELTEAKKNIAQNAYHLLSKWKIPPGLQTDGTYDGNALNSWLDAVKKECTESGHLEIAMIMVGHVLVHVPPDPDGLWINHAAAKVLNDKNAEDMRDGFRTEIFNSRGAHWVDPSGEPEMDFAAKYRKQAEALELAGYHRLANTLRELSKTYENEAERIRSRYPFDE
jgi:hypothetical protein